MLQILGYLGCVYLAFKGFEIWLAHRDKEKARDTESLAMIAFVLSIAGAIGFAIWLTQQSSALPRF